MPQPDVTALNGFGFETPSPPPPPQKAAKPPHNNPVAGFNGFEMPMLADEAKENSTTHSTPVKAPPIPTKVSTNGAREHKNYKDILSYEDKWIGWDGPVWCSRYGRFENQEDAAADDGYTNKGPLHHEDLSLHRCDIHNCACRLPFQHRSYVKDIQRRVEPMVESLVKLEHQVGRLVQHVLHHGNDPSAVALENGDSVAHGRANGVRDDRDDGELGRESAVHAHLRPVEESIAKLEGKVEGLMHQLHRFMKDQDQQFLMYGQNLVPPQRGSDGRV